MQPILDHITAVVRPALRKYFAAEKALSHALKSASAAAADQARQDLRLAARLAASELHHLSDFVSKEPSPLLPALKILADVRQAVSAKCVYLGTQKLIADVELLGDVANAFKHHRLDRANAKVADSNAIVSIGTGYAELPWGEGKYGGEEQVIVTTKDGHKRALSSVLQNVFNAWRILLGQSWAPIADDD
jgi:hypothetical protein